MADPTEDRYVAERAHYEEQSAERGIKNIHTQIEKENNNTLPRSASSSSYSSPRAPSSPTAVAGLKRSYQGHFGPRKTFIQSTSSSKTKPLSDNGEMPEQNYPYEAEDANRRFRLADLEPVGEQEVEENEDLNRILSYEPINAMPHITPPRPPTPYPPHHEIEEEEEDNEEDEEDEPIPGQHDSEAQSNTNIPSHVSGAHDVNVTDTATAETNPANNAATAAVSNAPRAARETQLGRPVYTSPAGIPFTQEQLNRMCHGVSNAVGDTVYFQPDFISYPWGQPSSYL